METTKPQSRSLLGIGSVAPSGVCTVGGMPRDWRIDWAGVFMLPLL